MRPRALAIAIAGALALALPASAGATTGATLDVAFTSAEVNAPTGGSLTVAISDPDAAGGKPSPLRQMQLNLPVGTEFDTGVLEQCTAGVNDLFAAPDTACPEGSKIGEGTAEGISGMGAGVDPQVENLVVYNGPNTLLVSAKPAGAYGYFFALQVNIAGSALFFTLPTFCLPPGTAPDCSSGEAGVSKIAISLRQTVSGVRSYLRTPGTCTSAGWLSTATLTFKDVAPLSLSKPMPCTVPPPPPPPPPVVSCVVPKLKGRTLAASKTALRRSQCRLGKVTRKHSARVKHGRVISSRPRAGTKLPKGAKVALTISG